MQRNAFAQAMVEDLERGDVISTPDYVLEVLRPHKTGGQRGVLCRSDEGVSVFLPQGVSVFFIYHEDPPGA